MDDMAKEEDYLRFARLVDQPLDGHQREQVPISTNGVMRRRVAPGIPITGPLPPVSVTPPSILNSPWFPWGVVTGGIALIVALALWGPKRAA